MSRLQVRANTRDVRIFRTRKPDVNIPVVHVVVPDDAEIRPTPGA